MGHLCSKIFAFKQGASNSAPIKTVRHWSHFKHCLHAWTPVLCAAGNIGFHGAHDNNSFWTATAAAVAVATRYSVASADAVTDAAVVGLPPPEMRRIRNFQVRPDPDRTGSEYFLIELNCRLTCRFIDTLTLTLWL